MANLCIVEIYKKLKDKRVLKKLVLADSEIDCVKKSVKLKKIYINYITLTRMPNKLIGVSLAANKFTRYIYKRTRKEDKDE